MSDTGLVYQFFNYLLYTVAKENGGGSGDSTFAAVVEKIVQQTGIRGIIVDNRITNVLKKKTGTMCAELKRTKKKSGSFGVKRLTDKWRDQTYSVKLLLLLFLFFFLYIILTYVLTLYLLLTRCLHYINLPYLQYIYYNTRNNCRIAR